MHAERSISRGKHFGILLRDLTTIKELAVLQDKDMAMGLGLGKYVSKCKAYLCL